LKNNHLEDRYRTDKLTIRWVLRAENERWNESDKGRVQYWDLVTMLEEVQSWVFGASVFVSKLVAISKKYSPHDLKVILTIRNNIPA
jgi:hypothetical protein